MCIESYDSRFPTISKQGHVLGAGFKFGCRSCREQAATAVLERTIKLVVAASFGNIFMTTSINNLLMTVELQNSMGRLSEEFLKTLTRRTGWLSKVILSVGP